MTSGIAIALAKPAKSFVARTAGKLLHRLGLRAELCNLA